MANNLNSLILEGVVKGEPHYSSEERKVLNFTIEVARYYKTRDGNNITESSQFKVVVYGYRADLPLKVGSCVRVVGRLREIKWVERVESIVGGVVHSEVQIIAEHIEIRKEK